jgi:cytochrome P450
MLELGLFIIFIVIGLIYFANVIRPKPIPGIQIADDYSWLLGHIKAFYANINNLHDYRLSHALKAERTGQTCFQELLPSMPARVDILTTELMQFVLKDKFDIFEKGDRFKQLSGEIFGNFLVTSDGLEWKKQRKLIMPMFSFREINAKMFSVFVSNAQKFIDLLKTMPSDKYIDMQNLFHHYTMDCTCEIAFGINIDTLTSSNAKEFEEAFDDAVEIVYNRLLVPDIIWKLKRKFNLGNHYLSFFPPLY